MRYKKNPKSSSEMFEMLESKRFDPNLEAYFSDLTEELNSVPNNTLPNQYIYYYDFYHREFIFSDNNIFKILGYNAEKLASPIFFYDIVHPGDRLLIYNASLRTVQFAHLNKETITEPFKHTFSMDFRIKKESGEYIRVLRHTGMAACDKYYNMVISFALNTDITKIKTNKTIQFDYSGGPEGVEFIRQNSTVKQELFTKQERKILYQLVRGKSSPEIAAKLFISRHTVDTHRRNMLKKSKLNNTTELVVFGMEHDLV